MRRSGRDARGSITRKARTASFARGVDCRAAPPAGEVRFRGRRSEVINVGGVKVHPLPVEERIVRLERGALACVFGRPNRLTGAIVAVEIVPVAGLTEADHENIRFEIKQAVADLPRAWQPRNVTFVDAIETRGEKIVRRMEV